MPRIAASVSILALAALSACVHEPARNAPQISRQELPYRAGNGVVTARTQAPAPMMAAAGGSTRTASPGGSAPSASATGPLYRLTIKMDNGVVQYVDTDNADIAVGSRVQLGADHTIRKL
jgi:hypothetical protein